MVGNIWTNPMIFDSSEEEIYRKFRVYGQMLKGLGVDIVDSEMSERASRLAAIYQQNK